MNPGLKITVTVCFDRQKPGKAKLLVHPLNLKQSSVPVQCLLINFRIAHSLKKSTLKISSGVTPEKPRFLSQAFDAGFIQEKPGLFNFGGFGSFSTSSVTYF